MYKKIVIVKKSVVRSDQYWSIVELPNQNIESVASIMRISIIVRDETHPLRQ